MEARDSFCFPKNAKNPNPSPIEKRFGFSILTVVLPVDIPTGWEPRAKQQPTGLIACGAMRRRPVQVLLSAVAADENYAYKTKKTAYKKLSSLWCSKAIQIRTISLGCNF